jgi:hypothetical protein
VKSSIPQQAIVIKRPEKALKKQSSNSNVAKIKPT